AAMGRSVARGCRPRPTSPLRDDRGSLRSALAGALAGDELVLRVGGPVLDREPEGPRLRKLRIGCRGQRRLALGSVIAPELGGDVDGGIGGLLAIEELRRENDARAGYGRRVRHGGALEARVGE